MVAASLEPAGAQSQLASMPCVAMETAPADIGGQKQDFHRGCQQFPDPDQDADLDRHRGEGKPPREVWCSRVRSSPGNPDPAPGRNPQGVRNPLPQ